MASSRSFSTSPATTGTSLGHDRRDIRVVCVDWGGTLMPEQGGPVDVPMAQWDDVRVIEGARELLATLAQRYTICVATNATVSRRPDIEHALDRGGLLTFIKDIFSYSDIGAKKSTRGFWDAVTKRRGCSTTEIAMLGDSLQEDVIGPAKFGVFSVWFNPTEAPTPDGIRSITRLRDFAEVLNSISRNPTSTRPT